MTVVHRSGPPAYLDRHLVQFDAGLRRDEFPSHQFDLGVIVRLSKAIDRRDSNHPPRTVPVHLHQVLHAISRSRDVIPANATDIGARRARVLGRGEMSVFGSSAEEVTRRHAEYLSDVEEPFVEQSAPAMLYMNQHVARHTRFKRQGFLRESLLDPQPPDAGTNLPAAIRPRDGSLGVGLGRTGGHASKYGFKIRESLPY